MMAKLVPDPLVLHSFNVLCPQPVLLPPGSDRFPFRVHPPTLIPALAYPLTLGQEELRTGCPGLEQKNVVNEPMVLAADLLWPNARFILGTASLLYMVPPALHHWAWARLGCPLR